MALKNCLFDSRSNLTLTKPSIKWLIFFRCHINATILFISICYTINYTMTIVSACDSCPRMKCFCISSVRRPFIPCDWEIPCKSHEIKESILVATTISFSSQHDTRKWHKLIFYSIFFNNWFLRVVNKHTNVKCYNHHLSRYCRWRDRRKGASDVDVCLSLKHDTTEEARKHKG